MNIDYRMDEGFMPGPEIYGLLPDHEIRRYIKITPFEVGVKRPGKISYGLSSYGYDARISNKFKIFSPMHGDVIIDPKSIDERVFFDFEGDVCTIPPNSYVLAETVEYFEIPRDVTAICLGKSSYARCGLICNLTPLESEWKGKITVEVSNAGPIPARLYAWEGAIQILFFRSPSPCEVSYADKKGKYDNQQGLVLAKVD